MAVKLLRGLCYNTWSNLKRLCKILWMTKWVERQDLNVLANLKILAKSLLNFQREMFKIVKVIT
jgi:hypothetical protein